MTQITVTLSRTFTIHPDIDDKAYIEKAAVEALEGFLAEQVENGSLDLDYITIDGVDEYLARQEGVS